MGCLGLVGTAPRGFSHRHRDLAESWTRWAYHVTAMLRTRVSYAGRPVLPERRSLRVPSEKLGNLSFDIDSSRLANHHCTMITTTLRPVSRILTPLPHFRIATASFASSSKSPNRASFTRPGPPPLPPAEQAEFEAQQKAAQTVGATPLSTSPAAEVAKQVDLEQHRDMRKGPRPDFVGDRNPKTGEMGGPKVDPFKAGDGDWSYAGRVTVSLFWNICLCLALTHVTRISSGRPGHLHLVVRARYTIQTQVAVQRHEYTMHCILTTGPGARVENENRIHCPDHLDHSSSSSSLSTAALRRPPISVSTTFAPGSSTTHLAWDARQLSQA